MMNRGAIQRRYSSFALYALALLFLSGPVIGLMGQLNPPAISNPEWRYGAFGLVAQNGVALVLAMFLGGLGSQLAEHGRVQFAIGVFSGLTALLFMVGPYFHFREGMRLRQGIPDNLLGSFNLHTGSSLLLLAGGGFLLCLLSFGMLRYRPTG